MAGQHVTHQGARHVWTLKPLRRGSHHIPTSSGREGTKSKRLQPQPRPQGWGRGFFLSTGKCSSSE